MTRHLRRIRELAVIAEDCTHPNKFDKYHHAASLYKNNRLIGVGTNKFRSHPLQAKFGRNNECIYLHAEIDAINSARKRNIDPTGSILYVARAKNGSLRNSKPCGGCQKAIDFYNIKMVYYSTGSVVDPIETLT